MSQGWKAVLTRPLPYLIGVAVFVVSLVLDKCVGSLAGTIFLLLFIALGLGAEVWALSRPWDDE